MYFTSSSSIARIRYEERPLTQFVYKILKIILFITNLADFDVLKVTVWSLPFDASVEGLITCTIASGNLEALYGGQTGWCFGYIQQPFHCGLTLDGASSGGLFLRRLQPAWGSPRYRGPRVPRRSQWAVGHCPI